MNKKVFIWLVVGVLVLSGIDYKMNNPKVKVNRDKIVEIVYIYEIEENKMGSFDLTSSTNKEDINSIVNSLNNGVLIPDEKEIGTFTLEHIQIFVLGDRDFSIYKQKDGSFTVMYTINPGSNNSNDDKQTTIKSVVLQSYFTKFKQASKNLGPSSTWDIHKN